MLKRKIEEILLAWKEETNHKPIVIKGCRQCGKTFSVQKFAHDHYQNKAINESLRYAEYKDVNDYLI